MRYTTRIIVPPRVKRSGQPGGGGAYKPQVLGVRRSFGFDDPFGMAAPGHLGAAALHPEFAPVFVQFAFTDTETGVRTPGEAMATTIRAVGSARFRLPWGADANLLRSPQEVEQAATAGFTYYTLDPGEFLRHDTDTLDEAAASAALNILIEEGTLSEDWSLPYLDRTVDLPGGQSLKLTLSPLQRAAVRFGRAIRHCSRLAEAVARANQGRPYEMEAFFGAMPGMTTSLEHLFIGLELESRGVRLTSLALTLVGPEDAASVRRGEHGEIEACLREHSAVAEFCGPYKLSFHNVSLLPSLYPVLGYCCGDALHIKTHHLSFLEAMRVISRTEPALFERIALAAIPTDPSSRDSREAFANLVARDPGSDWLEEPGDERSLARSAAIISLGSDGAGRPLKFVIAETLARHAEIYHEQLTALFDKRFTLLKTGRSFNSGDQQF